MIKPIGLLVFASFAAAAGAYESLPVAAGARFASGPQCFRANDVSNYTAAAARTINVRVGGDRWFQMRLSGDCPGFGEMLQVGLRPMDSSWLCEGKSDELIVGSHDGTQRCFVSDIRRLPPG